ncbi:unnamed protein product, partial [Polarella glacialis]
TTKLLQVGAEHGLTLYEIGTILYREDRETDDVKLQKSKLEHVIESCLDAALAVAGDGPSRSGVSATLSGLDLQTSRPSCRQVMSRQSSGPKDDYKMTPLFGPSSPFSSPLSTSPMGLDGRELAPPPLSLDGLSESDKDP